MVYRVLPKKLGVTVIVQVPLYSSPLDGVVVYPEGHRYTGKGSLPIKTGVLEVAWNLKVPCQCVLSKNKEFILNEKKLSFNYDVDIYTSISEVLHPENYQTKEEWFDAVRSTWDKTLKDAFESEEYIECGLPLPGIPENETHAYPTNNKRVLILLSVFVASVAVIYGIGKLIV